MGIKESLKNVAADLGMYEKDLYGNLVPRSRDFTNYYQGIATDESKQGYSPETINAMRAAATGALAGQKRSTQENVDRRIAASGMGNTGMGIRMAANLGKESMKQQREANRDVDLAQAEAKRSDKWNAGQMWQGGLGGERSDYGMLGQLLSAKVPALTGAHDVSFWGNFNDITSGLGNLLQGAGALFK